jgi:hypothetical protein
MSVSPFGYIKNLEKIMKKLDISVSVSSPYLFEIINRFLTTKKLDLKISKNLFQKDGIYLSYSQLEKNCIYFDGSATSIRPLLLIIKKIPNKNYSLRVDSFTTEWKTEEIKKVIEQLECLITSEKIKFKITTKEHEHEEEFIDIVVQLSAKNLTKTEVYKILETILQKFYVKKYKRFGITGEAKINLLSNNFSISAVCVETDHVVVEFSNKFKTITKIFNDTFLCDLKSSGYCLWYIKFLKNKGMQPKTIVRNYKESKKIINKLMKMGASNKEAICFSKYYKNPIKSFEEHKSKKIKGVLIRETCDVSHRKKTWSFCIGN